MAKAKHMTKRQVAKARGFASGLEDDIAAQLKKEGVNFDYEGVKLSYTVPESNHTYRPDFPLYNKAGLEVMIVETKGIWTMADRKKMKLVKEQHPHHEIRMVFNRSKDRISKKSKTTYGMWCDKLGILYADKTIPQEWLDEVNNGS